MAYPKPGLPLRQLLQQVKDGDAEAKKLDHPGLYYMSKELRGSERQGKNFDAQIKIGAAGLKEPVNPKDPTHGARKQVSLAHNRIPGRLQMYAGHQGVINARLLGARTLEGADAMNSHKIHKGGTQSSVQKGGYNRYLKAMEDAAKKTLAHEAGKEANDGLAIAQDAYTYNDDGELVRGNETAEYFLVDWDEKNKDGETPHQVIRRAMNAYQPPTANTDAPQDRLARNVGQPNRDPNMEYGFETARDMTPTQANKPIDVRTKLYRVAQGASAKTPVVEHWPDGGPPETRTRSGAVRDNSYQISAEKRKLRRLQESSRQQEQALWRARNL